MNDIFKHKDDPYVALWVAVIELAVVDLSSKKLSLVVEAIDFFHSKHFETITQMLNVDARSFRELVLKSV